MYTKGGIDVPIVCIILYTQSDRFETDEFRGSDYLRDILYYIPSDSFSVGYSLLKEY